MIGLAALAVVVVAFGANELLDYRNKAEFDSALWRNADNCGYDGCDAICTRGHMLRDLEWYHLKRGMLRSQVLALLGNAEANPSAPLKSLKYNLGMCSGFRMDYDSLILSFDDRDVLTDIRTVQH